MARVFRMTGILIVATWAGCVVHPTVVVIPSGSGIRAAPKQSDCKLDFFRTKTDQPYDELAALHVDILRDAVPLWNDVSYDEVQTQVAAQLQEAMRMKGCELGADAVIVTQDFFPSGKRDFMNGIAINTPPRIRMRQCGRISVGFTDPTPSAALA